MPLAETKSDTNLKLFVNTRRYLLYAIVLIWTIAGLSFFVIKPRVESVFELRKDLAHKNDHYQALIRKINELKQIEISQQFQQKEKVDEVLPSHKPVLELLFNLGQAMHETNVFISDLEVSPGEIEEADAETKTDQPVAAKTSTSARQNNYEALSLELIASGRRNNVDNFLELVERISPFTSIIELSIKDISRRETDGSVTEAQLLLHSYYYTQTISADIEDELPSVETEELKAFATIQKFMPSDFHRPTEIKSSDIEDLFGIEGFF